jgi:hypothetical protein
MRVADGAVRGEHNWSALLILRPFKVIIDYILKLSTPGNYFF